MTKAILVISALAVVGACGTDSKSVDATKVIDASKTIDASKVVDSRVFLDAPAKSTVNVIANCTGVDPNAIALQVNAGTPVAYTTVPASDPTNAVGTITAGQYVKFTSTADNHNMQSLSGTAATATFRSGDPSKHVACLQFTVPGTYPWDRMIHGMAMKGTLTVK